jgi:hypothetical protein
MMGRKPPRHFRKSGNTGAKIERTRSNMRAFFTTKDAPRKTRNFGHTGAKIIMQFDHQTAAKCIIAFQA